MVTWVSMGPARVRMGIGGKVPHTMGRMSQRRRRRCSGISTQANHVTEQIVSLRSRHTEAVRGSGLLEVLRTISEYAMVCLALVKNLTIRTPSAWERLLSERIMMGQQVNQRL